MILYFGDLDPSGKDIPRDLKDRFKTLKIPVTIKEIALTQKDIQQYNLPRNPAKKSINGKKGDPRYSWYYNKYGITYGVELDALPPNILQTKGEEAIRNHIKDQAKFISRKQKDRDDKDRWRDFFSSYF